MVPGRAVDDRGSDRSGDKNPAWASFEESIKGTLTPGKLADIAVFDTNLVEVGKSDPSRLLKAKVRYTIVDGRIVYPGK